MRRRILAGSSLALAIGALPPVSASAQRAAAPTSAPIRNVRYEITFDSTTADKTTVDGARSFGYHAVQDSTGLESDVYFLFRGRNELQVNCQWKDKESDISRGCKSVLGTLQFKTVP